MKILVPQLVNGKVEFVAVEVVSRSTQSDVKQLNATVAEIVSPDATVNNVVDFLPSKDGLVCAFNRRGDLYVFPGKPEGMALLRDKELALLVERTASEPEKFNVTQLQDFIARKLHLSTVVAELQRQKSVLEKEISKLESSVGGLHTNPRNKTPGLENVSQQINALESEIAKLDKRIEAASNFRRVRVFENVEDAMLQVWKDAKFANDIPIPGVIADPDSVIARDSKENPIRKEAVMSRVFAEPLAIDAMRQLMARGKQKIEYLGPNEDKGRIAVVFKIGDRAYIIPPPDFARRFTPQVTISKDAEEKMKYGLSVFGLRDQENEIKELVIFPSTEAALLQMWKDLKLSAQDMPDVLKANQPKSTYRDSIAVPNAVAAVNKTSTLSSQDILALKDDVFDIIYSDLPKMFFKGDGQDLTFEEKISVELGAIMVVDQKTVEALSDRLFDLIDRLVLNTTEEEMSSIIELLNKSIQNSHLTSEQKLLLNSRLIDAIELNKNISRNELHQPLSRLLDKALELPERQRQMFRESVPDSSRSLLLRLKEGEFAKILEDALEADKKRGIESRRRVSSTRSSGVSPEPMSPATHVSRKRASTYTKVPGRGLLINMLPIRKDSSLPTLEELQPKGSGEPAQPRRDSTVEEPARPRRSSTDGQPPEPPVPPRRGSRPGR